MSESAHSSLVSEEIFCFSLSFSFRVQFPSTENNTSHLIKVQPSLLHGRSSSSPGALLEHGHGPLPHPLHDPGQQDQPEVQEPLGPPHRADQPLPPDGAEAAQEGAAPPGKQRPEALQRPAQGAGDALQDPRPVREPLPLQLHEGARPQRHLRCPLRDARLQAEAVQGQDEVIGQGYHGLVRGVTKYSEYSYQITTLRSSKKQIHTYSTC